MKKAIYPGSFDPITNGHVDIIERAKRLFDEVCIAVIHNPAKSAFFSLYERIELIREVFKNDQRIKVAGFTGLLVDFAKKQQVFTIIRGLRAVSDFDYEFQMSLTNRKLEKQMNSVFFMTDESYSYLSSSIVKELALFKGDIDNFVPNIVKEKLEQKVKMKV